MSATTYMRRCLELAEIAALAGDTAVGALIVCGDKVVGEGVERIRAALDPSAHAEVEAIRQGCHHLERLDLRGCSLYSTVEPCVLCGYVIRRTSIARVIEANGRAVPPSAASLLHVRPAALSRLVPVRQRWMR